MHQWKTKQKIERERKKKKKKKRRCVFSAQYMSVREREKEN